MKYIFSIFTIMFCGNAWAGAVGGTGVSGLVFDSSKLLKVYQGANKISREALGEENLFQLDLKNKNVIFDAGGEILDESAVMTFDEVVKYSLPVPGGFSILDHEINNYLETNEQ